jgi:hypothetical protein
MSGRRRRRVAWAGAASLGIAGSAAIGLAFPHDGFGGLAWAIAVVAVLYGFGAVVRRSAGVELGSGEQLVAGTVVWIGGTGLLIAVGVASRGPLLAVALLGLAFAATDLVLRARDADDAPPAAPVPPAGLVDTTRGYRMLAAVLGIYLVANLIGTLQTRGNPFDDQVAYTAFVKRLLDCGDLIEPFSFRRLSAYGGQTALLALAALRGDVESSDLLDRGIYQLIAVLVVIDIARRRKVHPGVTTLVVVLLMTLRETTINSASHWSALAMFLGAYGFASADARAMPARTSLTITAATCAAAATLRQPFLVPAAVFVALLVCNHVRARARETSWRRAWAELRPTVLLVASVGAAVLVPYMIAAWRSSETFLYPVIPGTGNVAAPLRPIAGTVVDELEFFATVAIDTDPIQVWWVLIPFMVMARDPRSGRPWPAFLLACGLGFALLTHSFLLSDAANLWRYGFGYMTALALVFVIEAAADLSTFAGGSGAAPDVEREPRLRVSRVGAVVVWLAVLVQIVEGRAVPVRRIKAATGDVKAALAQGSRHSESRPALYRRMQETIPAGGAVAILVDDAHLVDYDRNRVFNLDMPGFAAPAPGLPSFTDPEQWRSYFIRHGIRYLAFTDGIRSTYLYRRRWWFGRLFEDGGLWPYVAAHMIDASDTFGALARSSRVLFDDAGLHAIDLGTVAVATTPSAEPELARMARFVRRLSEAEVGAGVWQLASRHDVVFDEVAPVRFELPIDIPTPLARLFALEPDVVDPPRRWLLDRTRIRVHGERRQRLRIRLFVDVDRMRAIPTVSVTLDGTTIAEAAPDDRWYVDVDTTTECTGWCDLYINLSTISETWHSAENYRVVALLGFEWEERVE